MPSKPPFFAQEKPETCALACLRMVLAYHGIQVSEDALARQVELEPGGVSISELERVARRLGLRAEARQLDLQAIATLLARGVYPIVYVQLSIAGELVGHAVLPIHVGRDSVTVLDPIAKPPGERQFSRRAFEAAQHWVSRWALVCEPAPAA
ncbi:MAG: C39 family peptidase [Planctomycetes bacterium]|nr:C39 family peptidase [Planctomycetota bacterium]